MKKLFTLSLLSCFAAYATNLEVSCTVDAMTLDTTVCLNECGKAECGNDSLKISFEEVSTEEADCVKLNCTVCAKDEEGCWKVVATSEVEVHGEEPAHVAMQAEGPLCSLAVKAVK